MNKTILPAINVNRVWRGVLLASALTLALGSVCSTPGFAEETRVERLVRQLGSESFDEREKAVKELIEIGAPALEALRKAASSSDAEVAMRAKASVPEIERNEKMLGLVARLNSNSAKERADAASGLAALGSGARKALPALIATVDDGDPQVRERAINALGAIGPFAAQAVPRLIRVLEDRNQTEDIRWCVVNSLGEIGAPAREAIPALLGLIEKERRLMKLAAMFALGKIGRGDKRVVLALMKALDNDDNRIQVRATLSLGALAEEHEIVVPALVRLIKKHKSDPDREDLIRCTISALKDFKTGAEPAVPVLVEMIVSPETALELRHEAAKLLGALGPVARDAAPVLSAWAKNNQAEATRLGAVAPAPRIRKETHCPRRVGRGTGR